MRTYNLSSVFMRELLKVKFIDKKPIHLDIKRTIGNKFIIKDHPEYEILLDPETMMIILFSKGNYGEANENYQLQLLKFLASEGAIKRTTIQTGTVFGSYQAELVESSEENSLHYCIFAISEFMESELEEIRRAEEYKKEKERFILEPDEDESTELGEIPHEVEKGSIHNDLRNYYSYNYFLYENDS